MNNINYEKNQNAEDIVYAAGFVMERPLSFDRSKEALYIQDLEYDTLHGDHLTLAYSHACVRSNSPSME